MPALVLEDNFFRQLNTLKLSLNLRLNQGMSGQRKSSGKGSSVEFSDFREYMLGDDLRRIDWNAYGRFDKLYIKEFMEEKEGIYRIFIDTSKSMDYGEKPKSVMALKLAAAFSYLVIKAGAFLADISRQFAIAGAEPEQSVREVDHVMNGFGIRKWSEVF
jgi:uncharacterized protein (DUF58 family)